MEKFDYVLRGHDIADNFSEMCLKAKENKIKLIYSKLNEKLKFYM